jgi:Asp-tRNA(Asn)/Glu-tRNA(Gln) amidotransferase A subunit family amidase
MRVMAATDLADFTALDLLAAYASGRASPVEAMRAVLGRADAWEPRLGALFAVDPVGAMASASESEHRWHRRETLGPLDGVPVTIKDLIATRGVAVPVGTAAADMRPADKDAPPAARVREAGGIIFAKTTMPDYGMLSSGLSSFHPLGRNPWDLTRTAGGSSGGAAAASAAGVGPLHVGTDIGGSVRLPAGWCGIFALKPSFGRVPIDPPYVGRVAGPMTRTVADSALLMRVLSRPDAADYMSLPWQDIAWSELEFSIRGKHVGLMMQAGCGLPVDPQVAAAVGAAARLFEDAGAIVAPATPFLTQPMLDALDLFWRTRFHAQIALLPQARRDRILPFIRAWAEGAEGASGAQVYAGFDAIMQMRALGNKTMRGFDFLLSPTAPVAAFPAALPCPTNDVREPFAHIGFTVPFNMTEQPAASVNCGYTPEGLPIGLQIVGRRFDDLGVLRAAAWYERARGEQRGWPKEGSVLF